MRDIYRGFIMYGDTRSSREEMRARHPRWYA